MVDGDDRRVQSLSGTYGGRVHDKRLGEEDDDQFPPCGLFQDTGLQGYTPDHVATDQPKQKPPGKERTDEENAENTRRARMRMLVEHVIAGVKRCRMVQEVFRHTKTHCADQVREIACGVHNFRATWRYATLE